MRVSNMTSSKGNKVANQCIIENCKIDMYNAETKSSIPIAGDMFQSYESNIAFIPAPQCMGTIKAYLDSRFWDYSVTTGKYRNQFLNETKKDTEAKIKSGEYKLVNLN